MTRTEKQEADLREIVTETLAQRSRTRRRTDCRLRRWLACCHEAGHIVVGMLRDPCCGQCYAVLRPEGGALATLPPRLCGRGLAVATAAGKWGMRLADQYPIPRMPRKPKTQTIERRRHEAVVEVFVENAEKFCASPDARTDDELIAAWVVKGYEGNPAEWMIRHRRLHAEARLLTWVNRARVVQIATEIYRTGAFHFAGVE